MPLDAIDGAKAIQLICSRYDQRDWRKKIEKMLGLPPSGLMDEVQRKIFVYLKVNLQAYKSRRADPPSWIVGGYATKEVIDRVKFNPKDVDPSFTQDHVGLLGTDPGSDVDLAWWDDMLVRWFLEPGEEEIEATPESEGETEPESADAEGRDAASSVPPSSSET